MPGRKLPGRVHPFFCFVFPALKGLPSAAAYIFHSTPGRIELLLNFIEVGAPVMQHIRPLLGVGLKKSKCKKNRENKNPNHITCLMRAKHSIEPTYFGIYQR